MMKNEKRVVEGSVVGDAVSKNKKVDSHVVK